MRNVRAWHALSPREGSALTSPTTRLESEGRTRNTICQNLDHGTVMSGTGRRPFAAKLPREQKENVT